MSRVELSHGTLHYHESGAGAPAVFLHGYLMDARLWDPVTHLLEGEFRCLVPELPFGAHPAGHARQLAAILPDARVELVPGSRTWIMRDQPERTAALIAELARRAAARQTA